MKKDSEKQQPAAPVELDVETIADLEVDDVDADIIKGGHSARCPKNDGGGGTVLVA